MGNLAEDQPLGFFPKSSRSLLSHQFLKWVTLNLLGRPLHVRHLPHHRLPPVLANLHLCAKQGNSTTCATTATTASFQPLHSSPVPMLSGAHLAAASPPPSRPAPTSPQKGLTSIVQSWQSPCTFPLCYSASTSLYCPVWLSSWLHVSCAPALLHKLL